MTAYVTYNRVPFSELKNLINEVHTTLEGVLLLNQCARPADSQGTFDQIHSSVVDAHLVCLEDGKVFKSLRRHLRVVHGLTPAQYRQKWGLDDAHPMVSPQYSRVRSDLAKAIGLGLRHRARRRNPEGASAGL